VLNIAVVSKPVTGGPVDPEVLEALGEAVRLCGSLGHRVEEVRLPLSKEQIERAGAVLVAEVAQLIQRREQELGRRAVIEDLDPENASLLHTCRTLSPEVLEQGRRSMHECKQAMQDFHRIYDVVLSPTQAILPPKASLNELTPDDGAAAEINDALSAFTFPFSVTGQPSMSVPLYWSRGGLPIGAMFTGRYGEDALLLRLASRLEEARPWFDRIPSLPSRS